MTWFQIPDCQDSCEASSWPKVIVVMASHTASIVSLLKFSSLPILKYCFNIVNIIIVYHNCIQTWQAILPALSHFWNFHHYQFWNIALILWISLLFFHFCLFFSILWKHTGGFNHKSMQTLRGSSPQTKKLTRNIEYLEWGPYISGHKWMLNTVVIPFSGTTTMLVKRLLIDKTITTSGTFPKPVLFFPVILHLTQ